MKRERQASNLKINLPRKLLNHFKNSRKAIIQKFATLWYLDRNRNYFLTALLYLMRNGYFLPNKCVLTQWLGKNEVSKHFPKLSIHQ